MTTFLLGENAPCQLEILAESRMLIQASSGGGKSRTLRRIAEQTHGKIQQLILDPEGELVSLRERFDYVLAAAAGGDTPAHPRSAALLAERLLELGVSAIIDLYELKRPQQVEFVQRFCEALTSAPKRLWHPVTVTIDEIQLFAPEGKPCASTEAVIGLATLGRKRGQCLIAATQRLSLLDKNVAATLQNKLIGFTGLDTDLKRAAFELGFDKQQMLGLRELPGMHFWAFGPALTRAPRLIAVGPHVTSHPKPGARLVATTPPPTEKIRALLPKLADLPAEAEQKAKTEAELRRELAEVRRQLTLAQRAQPAPAKERPPRVIEKPAISAATLAQLQRVVERLGTDMDRFQDFGGRLTEYTAILQAQLVAARAIHQGTPVAANGRSAAGAFPGVVRRALQEPAGRLHRNPPTRSRPTEGSADISQPQQRILDALAWLESIGRARGTKVQAGFLAGASPRSSSYQNNVSALRTAGLLDYPAPGWLVLTDAGRAQAQAPDQPLSINELHQVLRTKLPAPQMRILGVLAERYPHALTKEQLADGAQASAGSSSFQNNVSALRSLGLLDYPQTGQVVGTPLLMLEAE